MSGLFWSQAQTVPGRRAVEKYWRVALQLAHPPELAGAMGRFCIAGPSRQALSVATAATRGRLGAWGREAWASDPSDPSIIRTGINEFLWSSDLRTHEITGVVVGPQVGCDYQASTNFVLGAQADFSWASLEGEHFLFDVSQLLGRNRNFSATPTSTGLARSLGASGTHPNGRCSTSRVVALGLVRSRHHIF
jgi:hypothetical protein